MPTINKGSDYFGVLTYTGDGAASKTIVDTNAVSFTPDFVWVKGRSGATDHALYDAVRGTTKQLESNTTTAETTETTGLTGFVNGGFTVGNLAQMNTSGATYVAWCWKANGVGSSNTSGTITSTVSVNATAGFSIVTYTGTGANATVGHGLGVAPRMMIIKRRNQAEDWSVYHISIGATNKIFLDLTNATSADSTMWNNTTPTSSLFSIGTNTATNANTGTYVAYCWLEIAGFSRFGSYTGNGSADGPFVFTNFRPKFVIVKRTDSTGDWYVIDSSRATYNQIGPGLNPNTLSAEFTLNSPTGGALDFLSNGFKWRGTYVDMNASGGTYIFMAFAENPFKNSNAR